MRLWHKDLIPVLPRQQLLGQWRECCLIAKQISETGSPNHLLVNKIMEYPMEDFFTYGYGVFQEMYNRGYHPDWSRFVKWFNVETLKENNVKGDYFAEWHNARYLKQCFYNLQEKYDCGGISEEEWHDINFVCDGGAL